jgi:hypothetical protein
MSPEEVSPKSLGELRQKKSEEEFLPLRTHFLRTGVAFATPALPSNSYLTPLKTLLYTSSALRE